MHAATASACFRRLSDWVNSVSKHHAAARSFMLEYLFSPGLRLVSLVFVEAIPRLTPELRLLAQPPCPTLPQYRSPLIGPRGVPALAPSNTSIATTLAPAHTREV